MNTKTVLLICLGLLSLLAARIEAEEEKAKPEPEAEDGKAEADDGEPEAEDDEPETDDEESEEEEEEKPLPKLKSVKCTMFTAYKCIRDCNKQTGVPNCCSFKDGIHCECLRVAFIGNRPSSLSQFSQLVKAQFNCVRTNIENAVTAMKPSDDEDDEDDDDEEEEEEKPKPKPRIHKVKKHKN